MRFGNHKLVISNDQDVGLRERQEDYFGFWTTEDNRGRVLTALLVLADGMGGLEGGDAASVVAVDTFIAAMRKSDPTKPVSTRFETAARMANAEVHGIAGRTRKGIGSTLVALYLTPDEYCWTSIGDSVLYRIRGGVIERLNEDHNLGARLDRQIQRGEITPREAAAREEERDYLTSNLGLEEIPEIELSSPTPLLPGDRFVLASDGLSDTLCMGKIKDIVSSSAPDGLSPKLVEAALGLGNPRQDNISIVTASIEHGASLQKISLLTAATLSLIAPLIYLILSAITDNAGETSPATPDGGPLPARTIDTETAERMPKDTAAAPPQVVEGNVTIDAGTVDAGKEEEADTLHITRGKR